MDIKTFQRESCRTAPFNADPQNIIEYQNILGNYSMGLVGEWHELQVELAKVDISREQVPMEQVNAIEKEVGDVMHYAVNLLTILQTEVDEEIIKFRQVPTAEQLEQSLADILEIPKKHIYHGHEMDKDEFEGAIYDIIIHLKKGFDGAFERILDKNIEKLKLRYPDKFNSADSIARVDVK